MMRLVLAPDLLMALTGLSKSRLKTELEQLPPEHLLNAELLCQGLVDRGFLTEYQAGHAAAGRGSGLVVGQYVVLKELGHGSVGMVYQARHRLMGRLSALKVFSPEASDADNLERFLREIHATAKLDHPHLIKAYEAGEHQGAYYLAMEYVEGQNLHEKVEREGPLPLGQALDYFMQAAAGIGYAHSLGMIHRDVKPGNIMLDHQGRVRVLDLGLVRFIKGFSTMTTSIDGSVRGTAAFMAPEQAMSIRNADHRSDIYSLGSSLYFALTGKPMFLEKAIMQQLVAHQKKAPPWLRASRPEAPQSLEQLYQRMVAKDPAQRHQSMDEVIVGLQAVQAGQPLPDSAKEAENGPAGPSAEDEVVSEEPAWKRIFPFWSKRSKAST